MRHFRKTALCAALLLSSTALAQEDLMTPQSSPAPRIVGGTNATANEFPWLVRISQPGFNVWCGGSVLNANWIITAAHCVDADPASDFTITAGDHDNQVVATVEQTRGVSRIVMHPDFDANSLTNDIALLRLDAPLTITDEVRPIRVGAVPGAGTNVVVAGWGDTTEGGVTSRILQRVTLPIVSDATCGQTMSIDNTMFCAGPTGGGMDACQGDSGGPIFTRTADLDAVRLIGLVSWGNGCARPNLFGVYNETALYTSWIQRVTDPAFEAVARNDPAWSDSQGWADVTNYSTIQSVAVGNDLYMLARANRGMVTLRYDAGTDRWRGVAQNDPPWSDDLGWADVTNYSTIQAVGTQSDLYLLARANRGMITLRYDRGSDQWVSVASNDPPWADNVGWADLSNYSTIQAVGVGDELYLLARANRRMITLRYDRGGDRWVSAVSNDPIWSDDQGWADPTNYETIQAVSAGGTLYLLARANRGMVTLRLNRSAGRWDTVTANLPAWADDNGWSDRTNYETIQAVGVGSDLYLLARANRGMVTLRLDRAGNRWVRAAANDPVWSDAQGWADQTNYRTIEAFEHDDQLYLVARANAGMLFLRLDRSTGRWRAIGSADPAWSDNLGWSDVTNYSTIQTTATGDEIYLIARANAGMHTLRARRK